MAKGDGLQSFVDAQDAERDRLIVAIAQFQKDIASMQAKLDALNAAADQAVTDAKEINVDLTRKAPIVPRDSFPVAADVAVPEVKP